MTGYVCTCVLFTSTFKITKCITLYPVYNNKYSNNCLVRYSSVLVSTNNSSIDLYNCDIHTTTVLYCTFLKKNVCVLAFSRTLSLLYCYLCIVYTLLFVHSYTCLCRVLICLLLLVYLEQVQYIFTYKLFQFS